MIGRRLKSFDTILGAWSSESDINIENKDFLSKKNI
jgi:hypothetical protein